MAAAQASREQCPRKEDENFKNFLSPHVVLLFTLTYFYFASKFSAPSRRRSQKGNTVL